MNGRTSGKGDFLFILGPSTDAAGVAQRLMDGQHWRRGLAAYEPKTHVSSDMILAIGSGDVQYRGSAERGLMGQFDLTARDCSIDDLWSRWRNGQDIDPQGLPGSFAFVAWDAGGVACAFTDLFRSCPLYLRELPRGALALGTDLRLLADCTPRKPAVDILSAYHLLNLYYVPTPRSMYQGIAKIPPATRCDARNGTTRQKRYWMPSYPETERGTDLGAAARTLRAVMEHAVARQRPEAGVRWGTFLSGGTDSSSISGMLARARANAGPVHAFSIGFDEAGYNELGYCDIVARHFGLDAHQRIVTATDTLKLLPHIVQAYDEPAANSSSIPTMACAQLAREQGFDLLIGGDGGDEIFGGNERYRKDAIMQSFFRLPRPVKSFARFLTQIGARFDVRTMNRVGNFVRRSSLPNPERFYTDDAFASEWFETLLTKDFQNAVDRNASVDVLREVYERAQAPSELHKLMFLDLELTIADNDIVKVTRAARANDLVVRFPYLDRELVEFTGTLGANLKVQNSVKRRLFKIAVADLLPPAVINKKKQGFGLPIGHWFRTDSRYREMLHDTIGDPNARLRPLIENAGVQKLLARHQSGAWEHGGELWVLLMLELWLQREKAAI